MGYTRFGPGTVTVGSSPLDISFQVSGGGFTHSHDVADTVYTLSGEIPGDLTTQSAFTGTLLNDPVTGGVSEYAWTNHGTEQPLVYTPNTADEASFAATVRVLRMDYTADERGALSQADVEWIVIGDITPTWKAAP